jgi:hypothetical protein
MAIDPDLPLPPDAPDVQGRLTGLHGNLPGTGVAGCVFLEYVHVERKTMEGWVRVCMNVPAAFEPARLEERALLEPWTHKPLLAFWISSDADIADGDCLIRYDGSRWYVRSAPQLASGGGCIAALAERATEDGVFAPIFHGEPE